MAFGSEIRFKIGGDTSALSKSFVAAQSVAASAGKQIERKLGMKDAFKGLMQGIGIGSVDAIAQLVVRPFELGASRARTLLGLTSKLREIGTNEAVATGGRMTGLKAKAREANDLNVDIEQGEKLINELNDNPLTFVNPESLSILKDAEQELADMKVRQAQLQSEINIDNKNNARAGKEILEQDSNLSRIHRIEMRDGSEREKLQAKLLANNKEYAKIRQREGADSKEAYQALVASFAIGRQMQALDKKAREDKQAHLVGVGQQAAQRPSRRGRSETERIAARGAASQARAEDAALQGGDPDFIARMTEAANRDFKTAGERVAKATSKVDKDASLQGIKSSILDSNKILEEIKANLDPE